MECLLYLRSIGRGPILHQQPQQRIHRIPRKRHPRLLIIIHHTKQRIQLLERPLPTPISLLHILLILPLMLLHNNPQLHRDFIRLDQIGILPTFLDFLNGPFDLLLAADHFCVGAEVLLLGFGLEGALSLQVGEGVRGFFGD